MADLTFEPACVSLEFAFLVCLHSCLRSPSSSSRHSAPFRITALVQCLFSLCYVCSKTIAPLFQASPLHLSLSLAPPKTLSCLYICPYFTFRNGEQNPAVKLTCFLFALQGAQTLALVVLRCLYVWEERKILTKGMVAIPKGGA